MDTFSGAGGTAILMALLPPGISGVLKDPVAISSSPEYQGDWSSSGHFQMINTLATALFRGHMGPSWGPAPRPAGEAWGTT